MKVVKVTCVPERLNVRQTPILPATLSLVTKLLDRDIYWVAKIEQQKIGLVSKQSFSAPVCYQILDHAGMGWIAYEEVAKMFEHAGVSFTNADLKRVLRQMANNDSGKVSKASFEKAIRPFAQPT